MSFGFGKNSGPGVPSRPPSNPLFPVSPAAAAPPRFPAPRVASQPSSFPDSSAFPRFPSPRTASQPTNPTFPGTSATQLFPSPRTFESVTRSPSPFDTTRLASGFSQPSAGPSRDPSKPSSSEVLGRSRPPPVEYTDVFLREPYSNAMEGDADIVSNRYGHVASERKKSPSVIANSHSFSSPTAVFNKTLKPSLSPPKSRSVMNVARDCQSSQTISPSTDQIEEDTHLSRLPSHSLAKRTRSPPPAGQVFQTNSLSTDNDSDREEQAKAKRLARFKTELVEVEPSVIVHHGPNGTQKKNNSSRQIGRSVVESKNFSGYHSPGSMDDLSSDYDNENLQASSIIVGLCPDMCPESERAERERKGDLDRYERLDGDRNQTSKILAVKKYNRTAEREAGLIRPMPILQKTMEYLLSLLDQPYDESFLGLYNFLWDRMRAIRMDLRMQHIFDLKAITMLEKMIRLHIIAMHELCEFSKGEGFSEGFDAHLNIEQMNKTSVELFQLYDDHRKKGIYVPTEKEFRGYYALLKLDKHPGYKVEPAELSLDLSQMTPEIRQTQQVLFARDVARSCRTGNFIAFFRHARKASYLQACLMHAHFSKLRTQALASLHSGLQYGQGLPVTHVAKWLGMQGEDVETLLGYHGFLIKEFEEPYLVKDGPFLNDDKDYPTQGSILVHEKKSSTILEDILSPHLVTFPSETKTIQPLEENKPKTPVVQLVQGRSPHNVTVDEDMEIEAVPSPRSGFEVQPALKRPSSMQVRPLSEAIIVQPFSDRQRASADSPSCDTKTTKAFVGFQGHGMQEQLLPLTSEVGSTMSDHGQLSQTGPLWNSPIDQFVPVPRTSAFGLARQEDFKGLVPSSPETIKHSECNAIAAPLGSADVEELMPSDSKITSVMATSQEDSPLMQHFPAKEVADMEEIVEDDNVTSTYDKEVAEAKLRLLIRLWRRRFVRKKRLLEDNRIAANAAFSSLSLGLPLWQSKDKHATQWKLDIDKALHERHEKWQQSLVRWNVSDLVASILAEKNPKSSCICWKVLAFSWLQHGSYDIEAKSSMTRISLDEWLRYKFFPAKKDYSVGGLSMSAPGMSVWRKWGLNNSGDSACYLSIIKDAAACNSGIKLVGASAIVFPISETIPWDLQRNQLLNIARSLPSEAQIPLLIVFGSGENNLADLSSSIVGNLGLEDLDRSRVGNFLLVCLNERDDSGQFHGYFSDQKLKEALIWLASESCVQPVLSCVRTRELVSLHLNSGLDAVSFTVSDRVLANQCISAFNEALDQAVNDIVDASKANPTGWPCPEPFLLDESTAEFRVVKQFLPSLGWSLSDEVEPCISALKSCKLPYFPDDLSWLGEGCTTEEDIDDQIRLLQDCLIRYLTQTSNVMHLTMAEKEAYLMVQNCTRLELRGAEYKMAPNWVLIFRRVFNWRLNSESCFANKAYVLQQTRKTCSAQYLAKLAMEVPMSHHIVHPSLDEMVEVSCSPIVSKRISPKRLSNLAAVTSGEDVAGVNSLSHLMAETDLDQEYETRPVNDPGSHLTGNLVPKDGNKADKLITLLDQCNMLQDEIEKKLSFYF